MGLKQSFDCRLWLSQLLSTTRRDGIGTCLGSGNVVSPSNQLQLTVIVDTINKQVKLPLWQSLLFVQGHLCPPITHYVQTLGTLSGFLSVDHMLI